MKKLLISILGLLLFVGCANPVAPTPTPVNPPVVVVAPTSQKVVFKEGSISHVILFGSDSNPVRMNVVNEHNIGDSFSKVYSALGKPVLARIQPDNGIALVYNVAGMNERVYFVFRGGSGQLVRISNSPNTKIAE